MIIVCHICHFVILGNSFKYKILINDFYELGLWSYVSWIYIYLRNQCLSPLTLWFRIPIKRVVLDTTFCDKVLQWLATIRWFSTNTPISSTNKTDRHDITDILLKVAFSTINLKPIDLIFRFYCTAFFSCEYFLHYLYIISVLYLLHYLYIISVLYLLIL